MKCGTCTGSCLLMIVCVYACVSVQFGAVKLVLCGHQMHLIYMHQLRKRTNFTAPGCTCVHVCVYACCACMCECTCVYVCVYACVSIHACMHVVHACVSVCVFIVFRW